MYMLYRQQQKSPLKQIGIGRSKGTFGELLQGALHGEDEDFLVTLPIKCYTYASFQSDPLMSCVQVAPRHKTKSQRLASTILDYYGVPHGGKLTLISELPEGKGLASSSADLVATARAIEDCYSFKLPVPLLLSFMREIEPSDGVMYQGIVAFYHRQVRLHAFLGTLPSLRVLAIDEGGVIDTIEFNRKPKLFTYADRLKYLQMLEELTQAIRRFDHCTVGQIATQSARLNQRLNPKQALDQVIDICSRAKGLGVVTAHSGTRLGILLDSRSKLYERQVEQISDALRAIAGDVFSYTVEGEL